MLKILPGQKINVRNATKNKSNTISKHLNLLRKFLSETFPKIFILTANYFSPEKKSLKISRNVSFVADLVKRF